MVGSAPPSGLPERVPYSSAGSNQVRCPLCNGPVHEEGDLLVCAVGHVFEDEQMAHETNVRLAAALWMAIEALDNEATVLKIIKGSDRSQAEAWAEEASNQAQLLREFAQRHAPRRET
jgi:hypothetical protein